MAQITAAMVKELREMTGSGMMECKKALVEAEGDMDAAVDIMRKKGLAAAAKKAGRATNEGAVNAFVSEDAKTGALVEVSCETDFVASNPKFTGFIADVAKVAAEAKPATVEELLAAKMGEETVEAELTELIHVMGENMKIARFTVRSTEAGALSSYIHMGGKIGVLVDMTGGDEELGKDVAMQIAAAAPAAIDRSGVDAAALEHEKEVLRKQALEEGKPEKIVERMVEGRINKFYKEVCLNEQIFVKDSDKTVKDILGDVKVTAFTRYQLGEGIEKKQENFAAEVAAQMK